MSMSRGCPSSSRCMSSRCFGPRTGVQCGLPAPPAANPSERGGARSSDGQRKRHSKRLWVVLQHLRRELPGCQSGEQRSKLWHAGAPAHAYRQRPAGHLSVHEKQRGHDCGGCCAHLRRCAVLKQHAALQQCYSNPGTAGMQMSCHMTCYTLPCKPCACSCARACACACKHATMLSPS